MKKLLATFLILYSLLATPAYATYGLTKSLDLERGSTQFAEVADASQTGLDITSDITIEAWVNFESLPDGSNDLAVIIGKDDAGDANKRSYFFGIDYNGGTPRMLMLQGNTGGGGNAFVASDAYTPTTGTWVHLAVKRKQSTGDTKFYVNGAQHGATKAGTTESLRNGGAAFRIGARQEGASNISLLDGKVSLARIWNVERTEAEIAANMCNVYGTATTNMQGEWSLNDVYTDASGNGNTLTPSGSPVFATDVPATCTAPPVANAPAPAQEAIIFD